MASIWPATGAPSAFSASTSTDRWPTDFLHGSRGSGRILSQARPPGHGKTGAQSQRGHSQLRQRRPPRTRGDHQDADVRHQRCLDRGAGHCPGHHPQPDGGVAAAAEELRRRCHRQPAGHLLHARPAWRLHAGQSEAPCRSRNTNCPRSWVPRRHGCSRARSPPSIAHPRGVCAGRSLDRGRCHSPAAASPTCSPATVRSSSAG